MPSSYIKCCLSSFALINISHPKRISTLKLRGIKIFRWKRFSRPTSTKLESFLEPTDQTQTRSTISKRLIKSADFTYLYRNSSDATEPDIYCIRNTVKKCTLSFRQRALNAPNGCSAISCFPAETIFRGLNIASTGLPICSSVLICRRMKTGIIFRIFTNCHGD